MSISKFLIWYGLISSLIYLSASIISSYIKCIDKNIFDNIDLICYIKITDNNSTIYYFDTFSNYFSKLWRDNRSALLNSFYTFFILIKTIIFFYKIIFFINY